MLPLTCPSSNCTLCPRLKAFRDLWRVQEPSWFNSPVPPFYPETPLNQTQFLIIGLAPGLKGANRTGRPFTGDYAGDLLYATLKKFGFSSGEFKADPKDNLTLINTIIVNAVRCVPPENKPLASEINQCRQFLSPFFHQLPNLKAVLTLGLIAHQSTIRALGETISAHKFGHGKIYDISKLRVFSSYHCSRYNTNTYKLTPLMFEKIFEQIALFLKNSS